MKRLHLITLFFALFGFIIKAGPGLQINFARDKTLKQVYNKNKQIMTLLLVKKGIPVSLALSLKGSDHPYDIIQNDAALKVFLKKNGLTKENIKNANININGAIKITKKNGAIFNTKISLS